MTSYTRAQFLEAYQKWVSARVLVLKFDGYPESHVDMAMGIRNDAWDEYCDVRDGLRKGTSRNRRLRAEERANLVLVKGGPSESDPDSTP